MGGRRETYVLCPCFRPSSCVMQMPLLSMSLSLHKTKCVCSGGTLLLADCFAAVVRQTEGEARLLRSRIERRKDSGISLSLTLRVREEGSMAHIRACVSVCHCSQSCQADLSHASRRRRLQLRDTQTSPSDQGFAARESVQERGRLGCEFASLPPDPDP